jgi:predicted nucleic acid-binding protein
VYAVIDTCVLVSALRSNLGASFESLQAVRRGDIRIALSVALAIEYESVALRPGLVPAFTAQTPMLFSPHRVIDTISFRHCLAGFFQACWMKYG